MKRLDTHIVPFERVEARNGEVLDCKTGISDCWNQDESQVPVKYKTPLMQVYELEENATQIADWPDAQLHGQEH